MELSIGEIRSLIEALVAYSLEYGGVGGREEALLARLREVRARREEEIRRG